MHLSSGVVDRKGQRRCRADGYELRREAKVFGREGDRLGSVTGYESRDDKKEAKERESKMAVRHKEGHCPASI